MTTLALNYSKLHKNIRARVGSAALFAINWKIIFALAFLGMFVFLIFYAWQINSLTRGAYLINSYQNEINKLSEENKNLQISFAEDSFLGQALSQAEDMNLVKTTSVKYIQVLDNSVASAKR